MRDDVGAAIAKRADALLGTPFRLRGRRREAGLDCVGMVAHALPQNGASFSVPRDYSLRGNYLDRISVFFADDRFAIVADESWQSGDILLCCPANRQVHFAIVTQSGVVHAHAGLRRVALTPLPVPWPVIGHWRYIGE